MKAFGLAIVLCSGVLCGVAVAQQRPHGISTADMDLSVKPGDDFFAYANGAWLKRTEIPADRGTQGNSAMLNELASQRTADLIQEAAKANAPAGSNARKIADLYNSFMDEAGIEAKGMGPIKPQLAAIAAIRTKKQLARALGESVRADVDALNNTNFHTRNLFGLWVAPGFGDVEHYAGYLMQGGLELPDREYYLAETERMRDIRAKYLAHVAATMKLAGFADAEAKAAAIVGLEKAIAQTHVSLADSENVHRANNPWKRGEFAAKAPGLEWAEFFKGAGLEKVAGFIVWQPGAFTGEAALVASTPLETWKDWLAFHLLAAYSNVLPKAFAEEQFAFDGKVLQGIPQQRPRWQLGVAIVNGRLGDAVGQIYAKRYFSPEAKAQVEAMVVNIMAAFRTRLEGLQWMDPATKKEALAKLGTLYVGVGYPDQWRDYSEYEVKADDVFGNIWRGRLVDYRRQRARIGKAIDRKEWSMTPQTVNAVNLPLQNALNFPAAYLQPPMFDPEAPAAANYGAIGTTIGHEISHTFDTEGADFDSKGQVRDWWTKADREHFEAATAALAKQYDQYKPFPDISLNGRQTLGENIADVAGIAASLDAYHMSLHGQAAPVQNGFTGDQQFFIANAQKQQSKSREATLRRQVATDPHSPSEFRAATVRNIDAWYAAFDVKPGDKRYLAPAERVPVW